MIILANKKYVKSLDVIPFRNLESINFNKNNRWHNFQTFKPEEGKQLSNNHAAVRIRIPDARQPLITGLVIVRHLNGLRLVLNG